MRTAGLLPPSSPNTIFSPSARPPRAYQWSIGVQRELRRDLVVGASYVGNRGYWWSAENMDQYQCNCINDQLLAHYGLSRNNPASLALLTDLISSPQAIQAGFGPAYPGMPPNQTVNQQIRPVPQWASGGPSSFLGPPIGKTWYDGLQTKATKRFSHGLSAQVNFTWAKATDIGAAAEAPIFLSYNPVIQDVFNYGQAKQLNQLVPPLQTIISGSYITPKFAADKGGMKVLSQVVRDWQLGWLLRYQSGAMIQSATSTNQLINQLMRQGSFQNAPVVTDNAVPGMNPLAVDPNCGCFNPQTTVVLNPKAWSDPGSGQWGATAPFSSGYRWQRQPAESMSFGRNFRMGKEGKYNFFIRAEFQNIFNRLFLSQPVTGATTVSPTVSGGAYSGGYGTLATIGGAGAQPRSGQIVGRFTF